MDHRSLRSSAGSSDSPRSSTATSARGTAIIPRPVAAWPGVAADAARACGPAQASYSRQVKECLAVIADLIDNPDHQAGLREAVLTLSVLVGAISIARAVDDPDLSEGRQRPKPQPH